MGRGGVGNWCQGLTAVGGEGVTEPGGGSQGTHESLYQAMGKPAPRSLGEGCGLYWGAHPEPKTTYMAHSRGRGQTGDAWGPPAERSTPWHPARARTWTRRRCASAAAPPTGHRPRPAAQPSHGPRSAPWSRTCGRRRVKATSRQPGTQELIGGGGECSWAPPTCMCPVRCSAGHRPWPGR